MFKANTSEAPSVQLRRLARRWPAATALVIAGGMLMAAVGESLAGGCPPNVKCSLGTRFDVHEVIRRYTNSPQNSYAKRSPADLLAFSWRSPSDAEKLEVRSYLAKTYPDTDAGLFSRAMVEMAETGDKIAAKDLLRRCVAVNAANLYCRYNLAAYAEPAEAVAEYREILKQDPKFNDGKVARLLYFEYRDQMKDAAAAEAWLAEIRAQVPENPNRYVIEAMQHAGRGEHAKAEALYQQAIALGVLDIDVHEQLARLRLDKLAVSEPRKRDMALQGMRDYADYVRTVAPKRPELIHRAHLFVATRLADTLKTPELALDEYQAAYKVYPTAEVAANAYRDVSERAPNGSLDEKAAYDFLLTADEQFPDDPAIQTQLGLRAAARNDVDETKEHLEAAVRFAPTLSARIRAGIRVVQTIHEDQQLDFDKAHEVLRHLLELTPESNVAHPEVLRALYVDRLDAGDYSSALIALNRLERFRRQKGKVNEAWFQDRTRQLLGYLDDIKPFGNRGIDQLKQVASTPVASQPAAPGTVLAVSPDGTLMALGNMPMQLWDVRRRTKLADLGRAGNSKFSPDGRYLATISNFTAEGNYRTCELIIHDVATRRIHARDAVLCDTSAVAIRDLAWNPNGTKVAYAGAGVALTIYDVQKKRRVRKASGADLVFNGLLWTADNRILTGQATADHLTIWDADSLAVVRKLPGVDWPHALARTADSRFIAAIDDKRVLSVWDTRTWTRKQAKVPAWGVDSLVTHPKSDELLLLGDDQLTLSRFDLRTMKVVGQQSSREEATAFAYAPDGKTVYRGSAAGIELLRSDTLATTDLWRAVEPAKAVSDVKNGYFVSFDATGTHVWDVRTGSRKADLPLVAEKLLPLRGDSSRMLAVQPYQPGLGSKLAILDTTTMEVRPFATVPGPVAAIDATTTRVAVAMVGATGYGTAGVGAEILDTATGQRVHRIMLPIVTAPTRYGIITAPDVKRISLSASGSKLLVLSRWVDGVEASTVDSREIRVFDLATGMLDQSVSEYKEVSDASFDDAAEAVIHVVENDDGAIHDLATRKKVRSTKDRSDETVHVLTRRGGEVHCGLTFIELIKPSGERIYMRQPDNLVSLGVFEEANRLVLLNRAGEIGFYELPD